MADLTTDAVRDDALGTLATWLPGYTDPDASGRQWKIRLLDGTDDESMIVEYSRPFTSRPRSSFESEPEPRTFRIKITATEE